MLSPDMIRKVDKLYEEVEALRFDGDWLADELVKYWVEDQKSEFLTAEDFDKYRGLWSFSIRGTPGLSPERNVTDALRAQTSVYLQLHLMILAPDFAADFAIF